MALNKFVHSFGIHSITAFNRTTGLPYGDAQANGIVRVAAKADHSYNSELIDLRGGSISTPVATERGTTESEISMTLKEYPSWLFTLAGGIITNNAAEASGSASGLANKIGTSVFHATTGVAAVVAATAAELKDGRYFIKAVSATTVDIHVDTDISFKNGTDLAYVDGLLKITTAPLTVPGTSGSVAIPTTGLTLTGGSGTVALVTSDVATFVVRAGNIGSIDILLPGDPVPIEFAMTVYAQKRSTGDIVKVESPRVVLSSAPIMFSEYEFSAPELTVKRLYDVTTDSIGTISFIRR